MISLPFLTYTPVSLYPAPQIQKVTDIKNKQHAHLKKLTRLAESGEWQHLQTHTAHPDSGFDWWMFPIDRASAGRGDQYRVNNQEIDALMNDPIFMRNYRAGVCLVALSWGWDLEHERDAASESQKWTNYQVRLCRMLHSLKLFKQDDLRASLIHFIDRKNIRESLKPWLGFKNSL